jgi:uncharacterized membrane protein
MYSKVKLAGHPVHPMLIAFPVAFYTATVVCYLVYNSNQDLFWFKVAYVANIAGVVMAVVAALPGFIDWLNIPSGKKAKRTGMFHMVSNVVALLLFAICFFLQKDKWDETAPAVGSAVILSIAGLILTLVAGFLGWTLVQKHHVGVDEYVDDDALVTKKVQ